MLTGGKNLPVIVGRKKRIKPSPYFTKVKLLKLQVKLGISDRSTKLTTNFLRVELGKKAVESDLRSALHESNHKVENLFTLKKLLLEESVKEKGEGEEGSKNKKILVQKEQDVVACTDVEQLVAQVISERNLKQEEPVIQLGLDDGHSQLKVTFLIFKKVCNTFRSHFRSC